MSSAASFIRELAASGRHHFTTDEAVVALGGSVLAVRAALRRLKTKGEIGDPIFTADMTPLLASGRTWDFDAAYDRVRRDLVGLLPGEPWKSG